MRNLLSLFLACAVFAGEEKTVDPVRVPALVTLGNARCPVSGEAVKVTADWSGVRVGFCCEKCVAAFRKDPAPVLEKLGLKVAGTKEQPAVDLANAQCPVMGKPVKEGVFADLDGVRTHFCCAKCPKALAKDPAKAYQKLGYGYIPAVIDLRNKACPISGDATFEGEGAIFSDAQGIRVRLCCDKCIDAFQKDPMAAFAKLGVDPEKLKSAVK